MGENEVNTETLAGPDRLCGCSGRAWRAARTPLFAVVLLLSLVAIPAAAASPDFAALAAGQTEAVTSLRHWLHAHPELSLREFETQRRLRSELEGIPGIELLDGDWGTGLVAVLRGGKPGPLVAWRADIDGLPMRETTGLPFASTATDSLGDRAVGVMHACGHDLHAAILIGAARVLAPLRADMPGTVLFVLEPAEEVGAGAPTLLEAGLFTKIGKPAAIYAIHDHPTIRTGQVSYCPGHSAANVDDFSIRVLGKGGHGAYPHKTIDPIVIASEMVLALQAVVSREVDAARSAVVTVGSFHGGTTSNVIPDYVDLRGTVRTFEPEVREQLHTAVLRTVKGIAAAAGAPEPEIRYALGTPSVNNDPALVDETLPVLKRVVGSEKVVRYEPGMGGEDFSFYQEQVPGFIFRLGVGRPDRPEMNTHSPEFDPDEAALPLGVRLACEVLWDRLQRSGD